MTAPEPTVRIVTTEQVVACVPPGHECFRVLAVRLRLARDGRRWTVSVMGEPVNADGERHQGDSDDIPTFTEREALHLAAKIAPTLGIGGLSVADILARDEARRA